MSTTLLEQLRELSPSAKENLFRRLMAEESLGYLREKNSIVGFEVNLAADQVLSGFTLIAIQKHTIYAFCSDFDLQEEPKLVLFPPLEKLFDPAFELLHLQVIKKRYTDAKFQGMKLGQGALRDLVKDLTPPEKEVDISNGVAREMLEHIQHIQSGERVADRADAREEIPVKVTREQVVKEPEPAREQVFTEEPPYGEPGFEDGFEDNYDSFEESGYEDGYGGYEEDYGGYGEDYEIADEESALPEPEQPAEDERSLRLKAREFESLSDVTEFCAGQLGVPRPLAVTVVNKALQSGVAPEYRILLAVKLFCKLFDEKKI